MNRPTFSQLGCSVIALSFAVTFVTFAIRILAPRKGKLLHPPFPPNLPDNSDER